MNEKQKIKDAHEEAKAVMRSPIADGDVISKTRAGWAEKMNYVCEAFLEYERNIRDTNIEKDRKISEAQNNVLYLQAELKKAKVANEREEELNKILILHIKLLGGRE